jgi:N5-(cytidine 5'-diphosphoramidyl)-L-glutamine hydrolase
MIIGIVPTIREVYNNQFELSVDIRLFTFLRTIYKNCEFKILSDKKDLKIDFLCISGGNDVIDKSKKSIIRRDLDTFHYKNAKKKNIPILGICHGAQFIAKKENCTVLFEKQKIKPHKIFSIKIKKLNLVVNSYHNLIIKTLSPKCEMLAFDKKNYIECFKVKNFKILGIIWHPERYKTFKKIDIDLIKNYL